jgi:ethanolaminephosphotransferase
LSVRTGFLYGQLSSKVIVAQLTKGPFPFSPALLVPLAIPAIGVNTPLFGLYVASLLALSAEHSLTSDLPSFLALAPLSLPTRSHQHTPVRSLPIKQRSPILLPPILEIWYLHLALALSLISYLTSATAVVTAFTTYLNISCFSIPYPGSSAKATHSPLPTSDPDAEGEGEGERPAGVAGRVKKFGLQGLGMELKEMMGVEGRKRSNTTEREEGLQGNGVAAKEARRVARVQ